MATTKEQMNVQVTAATKQLAKTCATAHQKSLNVWVEIAILEKAARDRKTFNLDAMSKALKKVAKQYLPGKVATESPTATPADRFTTPSTVDLSNRETNRDRAIVGRTSAASYISSGMLRKAA